METLIKKEFERRLIEEGLSRIIVCLDILSEDEIWHKQNGNTNSVGNLVLHLCGNVKQYIQAGIDLQKDTRVRDEEFMLSSRVSKNVLKTNIENTVKGANLVVQNLTKDTFLEKRKVQGFDENVTSIIIHVIEHFSYHVGQITFYTKYVKNTDTAYYGGLDLNVTS